MMIPITRKEKYINEIVGGGDTAPETPQTREELFFADILGEVSAPSPITRIEKYLAKIAGKYDGELPEPVTRIEFFIARAAGMNVSIPTPITREEMFWADYSLIIEKEISGIPPLTFNAIAGTLKNYRIYGQTVDGESVGDRTGNLFDKNLCIEHAILSPNGDVNISATNAASVSDFIPVTSNNSYTINNTGSIRGKYYKGDYSAYQVSDFDFQPNQNSNTFVIPESVKYIRFTINNAVGVESVMLCEGSTLLPYEPYGYRVPVTVSNGTDSQIVPIYLPEQIKKVGDEAEYIDYSEQKLHRIGAEDIDVTLPALPTLSGTNTLSVGTEVQPSNVYIKYEGVR